ncbi:siderophore ABC transporter substrate-binding protein [Motilimonas eburnea]|uniref:siderophore ABC transporter substrate-binding protein n=1 Tax=Motilimonas eburnea TaxID=1737488 RepID=UPI001E4BA498|nr:siderophore ABC transporter substrate-binding protein [Motilimonas eburnea]MCE2570295.1 siderophore ABC transporter substrate-binding protein [Motilimonas eburnea]
MNYFIALIFTTLFYTTASFAKPITIEHYMGSTQLNPDPKRVVAIGFGPLDTLDYFGIKPIAVSNSSHLPSYLAQYGKQNYPSVGSLFEPDLETIYTQKPDLILVGPRGAPKYKELSEIAPTVVFAIGEGTDYWQGTQQQWRNLGKIFEIEAKVEAKIAELDAQFQAIKQHNQSKNIDALTLLSIGDNISTFGISSRFGVIYKEFGFKPSVSNNSVNPHGDVISYEFVLQAKPSHILVLDRNSLHNKQSQSLRQSLDNPLVKATPAYQQDQITYLDVDAWYLAMSGVTATETMVSDIKRAIKM